MSIVDEQILRKLWIRDKYEMVGGVIDELIWWFGDNVECRGNKNYSDIGFG